ncbi:MAG: diguanylate cyclase/phosphodiesterase with domain [Bacilli bacterium]|nr:diguanylate cyclase/phosphodiesterase with domain [Bacilli bacterium]
MWQGFPEFCKKKLDDSFFDSHLGVIYIDLIGFSRLELSYGQEIAQEVLSLSQNLLVQIAAEFSSKHFRQVTCHYVWDDCFVIFLACESYHQILSLNQFAVSAINELEQRIVLLKNPLLAAQDICFRHGTSSVLKEQFRDRNESTQDLFRAFVNASRQAKRVGGTIPLEEILEFEQILQDKLSTTLFQPILNLANNSIYGCEALSRGPQGSRFHSPEKLIQTAEKMGALFPLEQLFRENAIKNFSLDVQKQSFLHVHPGVANLFLNVHPQSMKDPKFISGETMKIVERFGLTPSQVVIEITEHQAIEDFTTFLQSINHYRNQGYRVAIDDTGSGYAGLQMIVEVLPDFIKLDMSMIRGIDTNGKKQIMVQTLVTLANNLGASTIAEGIETQTELETVQSLGVHYGQGYLLGRPNPSLVNTFGQVYSF